MFILFSLTRVTARWGKDVCDVFMFDDTIVAVKYETALVLYFWGLK